MSLPHKPAALLASLPSLIARLFICKCASLAAYRFCWTVSSSAPLRLPIGVSFVLCAGSCGKSYCAFRFSEPLPVALATLVLLLSNPPSLVPFFVVVCDDVATIARRLRIVNTLLRSNTQHICGQLRTLAPNNAPKNSSKIAPNCPKLPLDGCFAPLASRAQRSS